MKKVNAPESQDKLSQLGFTLIELSIVLVIIGLIVGGVLVGQDLIRAAEIRATVSQYEKYNSAINTFRTKYNGIPGDISGTQASAFGLFSTGMAGTTGLGDGNGLIESSGGTNVSLPAGEPLVFWRHMSDAALIDSSLGVSLASAGALGSSPTPAQYVPAAKMGRSNYFHAGSWDGLNYYVLGGDTGISSVGYTLAKALTPIETFNIDNKIDDGAPNTGIAIARSTTLAFGDVTTAQSAWTDTTGAAGDCMIGSASTSTANTYNRNASTGGNSPGCLLRLRFN